MHVPQKQQNPDASGVQVFTASAGNPTQPAFLLQFAKQSAFTLILECQLFCVRDSGNSTARRVLYKVLLNIYTAVRLGGYGCAKYKPLPASCQPHEPRTRPQNPRQLPKNYRKLLWWASICQQKSDRNRRNRLSGQYTYDLATIPQKTPSPTRKTPTPRKSQPAHLHPELPVSSPAAPTATRSESPQRPIPPRPAQTAPRPPAPC